MTRSTIVDSIGMPPARPFIFGEVLFDCFGEQEVPGGAPLNVAWHLHALGWNPLLISRVGQDEAGRAMVSRIRDWGMDTNGIQYDMQRPTGRVEITMKGKNHTFDILNDQAYDHIEPELFSGAVNPQQCGMLYHGSLALRGQSRNALLRLYEAAESPVFLDINLREPWWSKTEVLEMIQRATLLKLNEDELELLAPDDLKSASPESALQHIREAWNLKALWLTRGKQGAVYCSAETDLLKVAPDCADMPVVDTVGAGDAFSAAILGGFLKGTSPVETAKCATQLATRICGRQGATVADMDLYQGLDGVTNG